MHVRAIASAFPDWVVDNDTIASWSGLDARFIADKIGIDSRRFLAANEPPSSLAARACNSLFSAQPELARESVGLMVVVTQNGDYKLPHMGAILQNELRLAKTTATFDVGLGCSGYVYGLSVAKGLMASTGIAQAILVTCDPYSRLMRRDSRDVIGLFGDAATATWLSADRGLSIGLPDFGTDGSGAAHLIVRGGGGAHPASGIGIAGEGEQASQSLSMGGRAVFNFMLREVPESVARCLARNHLDKDDIDLFVFHQASKFMIDTLTERMALPRDKVVFDIARTGNTVSSSIPLILERLVADAPPRQKILVSGFGVGLSWATNILQYGAPA